MKAAVIRDRLALSIITGCKTFDGCQVCWLITLVTVDKNIFLLFLVLFICSYEMIELVPYTFTVTSHLILTFSLALTTFVGINIICVREHGFHVFSLFLPPGSSLGLAFLLVPIELVSYIFQPISLSVRLFANMMAGHTLLRIVAGFS